MAKNNKLKAYIRFDGSGRVVPSSLIVQAFKPKVGNWKEINANECCNYTSTTTTTTAAPTTTTTTSIVITTLTLSDCNSDIFTAYTTSPAFAVGIMIYQDNALTIPYDSILLGTDIYSIYKYVITNGLVTSAQVICD
jgi:hypothetical protein